MQAAQATLDGRRTAFHAALVWGDEGVVADTAPSRRGSFLLAMPAAGLSALAAWFAVVWLGNALP